MLANVGQWIADFTLLGYAILIAFVVIQILRQWHKLNALGY